jgi:hypothetical protein
VCHVATNTGNTGVRIAELIRIEEEKLENYGKCQVSGVRLLPDASQGIT